MPIQIYNSLTKKKEPLTVPKGQPLRIYSCGVTVYDKCHLGHARSLYNFDVITRYLKYRGYNVKFVRNITDVDDKIINKAKECGMTFEDVVRENVEFYQRDLQSLGISPADEEPCATENIDAIINAVAMLIQKGHAYESDGDVYFSVRSFKKYGQLSGQSIEKMLEAVRIDKTDKKKDPLDFALWKKAKAGEPSWTSPWGEGRPGWHIECSCMSMKYLGSETIDIHAGGRDLIFPHHENEIAQSEALTGKPFARYWVHNGLLKINGQKMAKSLGNFITVDEIVRRYEVDDLKRFFLSAHYASEIDFSDDKIQEMHQAMSRIKTFLSKAATEEGASLTAEETQAMCALQDRFFAAMDDDFNAPMALGIVAEMMTYANKAGSATVGRQVARFIKDVFITVFGMQLASPADAKLSDEVRRLLDERVSARAEKNYQRSDELRDQLKSLGFIVEDEKEGQTWRKA